MFLDSGFLLHSFRAVLSQCKFPFLFLDVVLFTNAMALKVITKAKINVSKVLQEALKKELGVVK